MDNATHGKKRHELCSCLRGLFPDFQSTPSPPLQRSDIVWHPDTTAAALEPGEEASPTVLRLAIPQLDAQDLAVPSRIDADGNECCERAHALLLTHLHHQRMAQLSPQERSALSRH